MKKGKAQIEQDIYDAIAPFFEGKIGGSFYQSDTRPSDSRKEDAVIVASTPSGDQFQTGRVRILVFIPDIDCGAGRPMPDIERMQEIESLGQPIIDTLHDSLAEYSFAFFTAPDTGHHPDTSEHFVNIHLQYKRQTF